MGTFDISHPDIVEFIRAKREDGRLRQFNLSLLITEEFMEAVKKNNDWDLAFPITQKEIDEDGLDINDESLFVWREWPFAPNKQGFIINIQSILINFFLGYRERKVPIIILFNSLHKLFGYQKR